MMQNIGFFHDAIKLFIPAVWAVRECTALMLEATFVSSYPLHTINRP